MEISKRLAVPENLGCVALLACQNKRERKKRIGIKGLEEDECSIDSLCWID